MDDRGLCSKSGRKPSQRWRWLACIFTSSAHRQHKDTGPAGFGRQVDPGQAADNSTSDVSNNHRTWRPNPLTLFGQRRESCAFGKTIFNALSLINQMLTFNRSNLLLDPNLLFYKLNSLQNLVIAGYQTVSLMFTLSKIINQAHSSLIVELTCV